MSLLGVQCNVISTETYSRISDTPLRKSKAKLTAFGRQRLEPRGKATLLCEYNCQFWPINFEVLDGVSNVLGLRTSEEMGLIKRVSALSNDIVSQYADNFTGLG